MITSIASKPFEAFARIFEIETKLEDKIKNFAKNTFSSIKNLNKEKAKQKLSDLKQVPSKTINFMKENKFTLAIAAISLAISMVVFLKVSATAAILFLGAASFVKACVYTRSYVKSIDYQFKKLAKNYINSLEMISKNYKNGRQVSTDAVTGSIKDNYFTRHVKLTEFIFNNAENYSQRTKWQNYLKNLNPNLSLANNSLLKCTRFKEINDNAFKDAGVRIPFSEYNKALFNDLDFKEKRWFENELLKLSKDIDPKSATLKEDILKKSETLKSFLTDSTKNDIVSNVYDEMNAEASMFSRIFR